MGIPHVVFTDLNTGIGYNSFLDYGLILSKQEIGLPPVKTKQIDIEGMNGSLDMTEGFGEILYKNRTLTFTFNIVTDYSTWEEIRTKMATDLHGKRVRIEIYSDPDFYYIGRLSINKYSSSKKLGTITVQCDCEPYKYGESFYRTFDLGDAAATTEEVAFTVTGAPVRMLLNTLRAKEDITFKIDSEPSFTLAAAQQNFYPNLIQPGTHVIKVTGKGTVEIGFYNKEI